MPSDGTAHSHLDDLFPAPSLPPSQLSPQRLPGASLGSLVALQDVLKDNHQRYHIFFNHIRFHNHITHRALAIYALGGPASVIRDYYKRDSHIQRPAFPSPESITEHNFVDHLGDENYYQAYISFFSKQVSENGAANTLEEFIFSEKYNIQKGRDANAQPELLNRLFSDLLHPLIHAGYGLEFGLKGMLVEGLALAAVHAVHVTEYLPPSLFPTPSSTNDADHVLSRLSSSMLDIPAVASCPVSKMGGVHAFDIAAHILKDDRLCQAASADFISEFGEQQSLAKYSGMVREHAERWTINLNKPGEIERKLEEVIWLSSLIYGAGGLTADGFKADFILVHMVTSSLFLPSLLAYLSPRSQVLLLRGYLLTVLVWWVVRGRPTPNVKLLITTTSLEPPVPITPASGISPSTETTPTPNPFLPILQSAITHPNDHLIKTQRAFAHFDTLYGRRRAGYFEGTELADAAVLDGSLFLRAGLLTADAVGWAREGMETKPFDGQGFF